MNSIPDIFFEISFILPIFSSWESFSYDFLIGTFVLIVGEESNVLLLTVLGFLWNPFAHFYFQLLVDQIDIVERLLN